MNKTFIEWCDMTWNPVTGCFHDCPYCYAKRITHRFGDKEGEERKCHCLDYYDGRKINYPFGFDPTFYRYRLNEPQHIKKTQNIFVCSMADLFGDWVPEAWIQEVFKACEKAPQHRYLFLTKNPKRYEQFIDRPMPDNMWFGFSQTESEHIGFDTHPSWNTFVSMEPLLEPLGKSAPQGIDWVIIGAETGNRKGKVTPKWEWIDDIIRKCRELKIPVFMKNSLAEIWHKPLIQEYPWKEAA
jgi:protein gp37